jgi:hypothetical protein
MGKHTIIFLGPLVVTRMLDWPATGLSASVQSGDLVVNWGRTEMRLRLPFSKGRGNVSKSKTVKGIGGGSEP